MYNNKVRNINISSRIQLHAVLSLSIMLLAFAYVESLPKSYQKKVDKELALLWPETEMTLQLIAIDAENLDQAKAIGIQNIYQLVSNEKVEGFLAHAKVPSKFDDFDIAIIYSPSFEIASMKVLAYREDHGGEVGSKRWLRQFVGKNVDDPITLNDDIQGISGATISCVSATVGAKEITHFISTLVIY